MGTERELQKRPFQPAPEVQSFLDQVEKVGNDLDTITEKNVSMVRWVREQRAQNSLWPIPVEQVCNLVLPGKKAAVRARLYVPSDKQLARRGLIPVVVYFHGGGWTLGSVGCYDSVTRLLARQIPALVLSADYRLAPEHPFPAAIQDAETVLSWVSENAEEIGGDCHRIVVAGDSAGGNLGIVSARRVQARVRHSIAMQVLFYPSTNISSTDYASYQQYGEGHLLTRNAVERFRAFYLPEPSDWLHPDASPLLASDMPCPPTTLLIAAGCDPLRDEGEAYARKLRAAGVKVIYRLEPQLIHGFLNLYNLHPDCSPYAEGVLGYAAGVIRQELQWSFSVENM